jgi:hypothetical protein
MLRWLFTDSLEGCAMPLHVFLLAVSLTQPTAFINRELAQQWQAQKLTPSERTTDLEFLRRASLDLIGRIPTVKEQQAYLADDAAQRRRLLIDRLLGHDDYARHWAHVWSAWLLGGSAEADAQAAFHGWLQQHFANNRSHKELAERLLTAAGTTRDNPAVHFYVAQRGQQLRVKEWQDYGQYDMIPLTGQVFRALHGRRLQVRPVPRSPVRRWRPPGSLFRDERVLPPGPLHAQAVAQPQRRGRNQ